MPSDFIQKALQYIGLSRDPLPQIILDQGPEVTIEIGSPNDDKITISGRVVNGSGVDCPVSWFCYQTDGRAGLIWLNADHSFSVTLQVQFSENLYTFTVPTRDGGCASNSVVVYRK